MNARPEPTLLLLAIGLVLASLAGSSPCQAQQVIREGGELITKRTVILPYAFWTDSTKVMAGGLYATTIEDQPWTSAFVTAFASTNATFPLYGGVFDMRILPRLFVDPRFHVGRWGQVRAYSVVAPFPDPQPGSHDSDDDLFIDDNALDWWVEIPFHYVLPIGGGRESAIATYDLEGGLLVAGPPAADKWNPLTHGITQIRTELFAREQSFDVFGDASDFKTLGIEIGLDYDNRDFRINPSKGSRQQFTLSYDPDWFSSGGEWVSWEVELSKYFDFGSSKHLRQRVLALNFWTTDSPTADSELLDDGRRVVSDRPPHFRGANLGGFYRMRAFPTARFNDAAAIYYSAELRLIPNWNPIPRINFIIEVEVDWWQLVPFVEVGRVNEDWSISELHSDLDWDVGIDLRAMISKAVFRAGVAVSDEGFGFRAMVSHPF